MLRRSHERVPDEWLEETRGDRGSRRSASRKEGGIRPPRREKTADSVNDFFMDAVKEAGDLMTRRSG